MLSYGVLPAHTSRVYWLLTVPRTYVPYVDTWAHVCGHVSARRTSTHTRLWLPDVLTSNSQALSTALTGSLPVLGNWENEKSIWHTLYAVQAFRMTFRLQHTKENVHEHFTRPTCLPCTGLTDVSPADSLEKSSEGSWDWGSNGVYLCKLHTTFIRAKGALQATAHWSCANHTRHATLWSVVGLYPTAALSAP